MNHKIIAFAAALIAFAPLVTSAQPDDAAATELRHRARVLDDTTVQRERAGRVIDEHGNIVRQGHDRGENHVDGSKRRGQKRVTVDENGNDVERRRHGRTVGDGHSQARRGQNVTNEDGELIRTHRDRGENNADGSRKREQKRARRNVDGDQVQRGRRGTRDGAGNITRQRGKRKKSG